jgi:hypothetical protein
MVSTLIDIKSEMFFDPVSAAAGSSPVHRPRATALDESPSNEGSFSTSLVVPVSKVHERDPKGIAQDQFC